MSSSKLPRGNDPKSETMQQGLVGGLVNMKGGEEGNDRAFYGRKEKMLPREKEGQDRGVLGAQKGTAAREQNKDEGDEDHGGHGVQEETLSREKVKREAEEKCRKLFQGYLDKLGTQDPKEQMVALIRIVADMLDALPSTSSSTFDSDKGHPGDRSSGGRDREVPGMEASEGQGESVTASKKEELTAKAAPNLPQHGYNKPLIRLKLGPVTESKAREFAAKAALNFQKHGHNEPVKSLKLVIYSGLRCKRVSSDDEEGEEGNKEMDGVDHGSGQTRAFHPPKKRRQAGTLPRKVGVRGYKSWPRANNGGNISAEEGGLGDPGDLKTD